MIRLTPWRHPLSATVAVPGDKSLTHRGILFAAVASGVSRVTGWLDAQDTRSSLRLVQQLGVEIKELTPETLVLESPGLFGLREPEDVVDCGNSGTTIRLAAGLVSAVPGLTVFTGDASLRKRPMRRVLEPLASLGVRSLARQDGYAPFAVAGGPHQGGTVEMTVASAQVKSSLLLAGLSASAPLTVREPVASRDHTERLLAYLGVPIRVSGTTVTVEPVRRVEPLDFAVPGDPSSAAFWAALAALLPESRLYLPHLLLNPTRTGFFQVLERMGASVRSTVVQTAPEMVGDVEILPGRLTATRVTAEEVPSLIDEIPLVALLATQAEGVTEIQGAHELRVKESDRIQVTADILSRMGAAVEPRPDGFRIEGPTRLKGAEIDAHGDHRMAMLAAVAAAIADGETVIHGAEAVAISYPGFMAQYAENAGR